MPAADDPITEIVSDIQLFREPSQEMPDAVRASVEGRGFTGGPPCSAWRFATDDGRVLWMPVSNELLDESDDNKPDSFALGMAARGLDRMQVD